MKKLMSVVLLLWAGVMLQAQQLTVLGNYAPVLPLTTDDVAVVSIGKKGKDKEFLSAIAQYASVTSFQLTDNSEEKEYQKIAEQLLKFRRVLISVTGETIDVRFHRKFLSSLDIPAPLVYVIFSSDRMLHLLADPLEKAAAVVVTYEDNDRLQQEAAHVIFGKASASGKLPFAIGKLFPLNSGVMLEAGAEAGVVPEDYGMKSYILNREINQIIEESLADTIFPGCQVLVLKDGLPMYDRQMGTLSDKIQTPVSPTDVYDIGELTQTNATLPAIMKLLDDGLLTLDDKISTYLPELQKSDKKDITIREVLFHEAGLTPVIRFYQQLIDDHSVQGPFFQGFVDQWHYTRVGYLTIACSDFQFKKGYISDHSTPTHSLQMAHNMWLTNGFRNSMLQTIARSELRDKKYVPSSVGFILLQMVIETITGTSLDAYMEREFYAPMGLKRTLYHPLQRIDKSEIAPTAANEFLRRQDIHGYVLDEAAACLGGVAGNAGLFSNATEIAALYTLFLNGGEYQGKRYLKESTCRMFTGLRSDISHRGLGFDRPNIHHVNNWLANNCSVSTPAEVFGHTGFTGCCAWADPVNNLIYVFVSNRVCPEGWNDKLIQLRIREQIQEVIYKSME